MSARRRGSRMPPWMLIGVPLFALVLVLVVWAIPSWMTRKPEVRGADRYKAMADIRAALIALSAAVGAAGGLTYTAKTYRLSQISQLNGRFQTASMQMGEANPTVRLAGIQAMAQLADEWAGQRQTCVDVICSYLRSAPDPSAVPVYADTRRRTIDLISERLRPDHVRWPVSRRFRARWEGCDLDLTGAWLDVGDFSNVVFSQGQFLFQEAHLVGSVSFDGAQFLTGARVSFEHATFEKNCRVSFNDAKFLGGQVSFNKAKLTDGEVHFLRARFPQNCQVTFADARLGGDGSILFDQAEFTGAGATFSDAKFVAGDGQVSFQEVAFAHMSFDGAEFAIDVVFEDANLAGAELTFKGAHLKDGTLSFAKAYCSGATFVLHGVVSTGGRIDLRGANVDGFRTEGSELDESALLMR